MRKRLIKIKNRKIAFFPDNRRWDTSKFHSPAIENKIIIKILKMGFKLIMCILTVF